MLNEFHRNNSSPVQPLVLNKYVILLMLPSVAYCSMYFPATSNGEAHLSLGANCPFFVQYIMDSALSSCYLVKVYAVK